MLLKRRGPTLLLDNTTLAPSKRGPKEFNLDSLVSVMVLPLEKPDLPVLSVF